MNMNKQIDNFNQKFNNSVSLIHCPIKEQLFAHEFTRLTILTTFKTW